MRDDDATGPMKTGMRRLGSKDRARPAGRTSQRLTHIDDKGAARMVDVGEKPATVREATAECVVRMSPETVRKVREGSAKGDAIQVARVAGIMAAKRTPDLVPLAHPLPLTSVKVDLEYVAGGIRIVATARVTGQTGVEVSGPEVVPDTHDRISDAIVGAVVNGADFVVTTGGTGLGPRDVTPQATSMLIDYEVPGLGELMRRAGQTSTPMASLSRGLAGVRGHALILNVPGSMRGATESLEAVLP